MRHTPCTLLSTSKHPTSNFRNFPPSTNPHSSNQPSTPQATQQATSQAHSQRPSPKPNNSTQSPSQSPSNRESRGGESPFSLQSRSIRNNTTCLASNVSCVLHICSAFAPLSKGTIAEQYQSLNSICYACYA